MNKLKVFSLAIVFFTSCHSYIADTESLPQVYSIHHTKGKTKYFCFTKFEKETVYFSFTDSINKFKVGDTVIFTTNKQHGNKINAYGTSK